MAVKHSNFYSNTLATPPTGTTEAAFTVTSAVGLPTLGIGDTCYVVIKNASLTREIIKITTIVGTTLTPAVGGRGADGSAAYASWLAGDVVEQCPVNASLLDLLYEFKNSFFNVANTFKSIFTNTNTAARTYTFADRDGNIITDADINAAASKAAPVAADVLLLLDSAAAFGMKKATLAAVKTTNQEFVSGTRLAFVQLAAPTGWVIDAACNDQVLIAMAAAGDAVAGSWTISGLSAVTGSTALTAAQIPLHTHNFTSYQATGGGFLASNSVAASSVNNVTDGGNGLSGLGHTHTLTTTGDAVWRPRYRGVIVCIKL